MAGYEIKLDGKWVDVPEWARWVAQHKNGKWIFCALEPILVDPNYDWWWVLSVLWINATQGRPRKNWKEQIYKIERV